MWICPIHDDVLLRAGEKCQGCQDKQDNENMVYVLHKVVLHWNCDLLQGLVFKGVYASLAAAAAAVPGQGETVSGQYIEAEWKAIPAGTDDGWGRARGPLWTTTWNDDDYVIEEVVSQ